ncbi:hypothetical protein BDV19DRAFT_310746 [Aspergillus venezuelensis]
MYPRRGESTPPNDFYLKGRTVAPFFCHDLTPRNHRVTFELSSVTQHPSGATGIEAIEILVPQGELGPYASLYASIVGAPPAIYQGKQSSTWRRAYPAFPDFFALRRRTQQQRDDFCKQRASVFTPLSCGRRRMSRSSF